MLRHWKFVPILLAFFAVPVFAAPQSADAFLHGIYAQYLGDGRTTGLGVHLDTAADLHRYFTDDLAAMVMADEDAANKRGDVPALDGDPFVDAQDWQITDVKVHIDSQTATAAKATVTFQNIKEPETVHLALAETPKGWRISDIFWKEGSLRGLYKKKS
jgi:hypothetical protein